MIYRLQLSDSAKTDLTEAIAWYGSKGPGIAALFEVQVKASFALLCRHPLAFGIVRKRVRKINVNVFPYSIFYEIHKNHIVVLAVLHHSRYPRFGHH